MSKRKRIADNQLQPAVNQYAKKEPISVLNVPPTCTLPTEDEGVDLIDFEGVWADLKKVSGYSLNNNF